MKRVLILLLLTGCAIIAQSKPGFQIARVKYDGGGDWYNDPSAEINLLKFAREKTNVDVYSEYVFVDIATDELFGYPMLFFTGHGKIVLSDSEIEKLRDYLLKGGFIYFDDDYGLDKSVRKIVKRIFPEKTFYEIPFSHEIYHNVFDFPAGPPKTHEHDNKAPRGFGLFLEERLAIYYTYESNPSDGWADTNVHNDPENKREEALKFGTNIIVYALTN